MAKKEIEIVICINGQQAVDAGYEFQGNYCYRGIYDHGKKIAQLEVVIDEHGEYNGRPNKWVDVTCTVGVSVKKVLKQLKRLGFDGCDAYLEYTIYKYDDNDNYIDCEDGESNGYFKI